MASILDLVDPLVKRLGTVDSAQILSLQTKNGIVSRIIIGKICEDASALLIALADDNKILLNVIENKDIEISKSELKVKEYQQKLTDAGLKFY